jgi:hypothetical protein
MLAADEGLAELSDADSDFDQDDNAEVLSHRSSQPFLPVTRENLEHISTASTFKYFYEEDLKSLDLTPDCDEELLCPMPPIDVDKFFVKIPTTLISKLSLLYTSRPYFMPINCAFADTYTLQLATDPFCVSVPLSEGLRTVIIDNLSTVHDVLCCPNNNPRVLSARQMVIDSAVLEQALLASDIGSVYLSSYGAKLSLNRFQDSIGKYVEPWSAEYIANLTTVLYTPMQEQRYPVTDPVVLEMNNTYDIGKTFHTGKGSIIVFHALGQRRNRQWRNMYHLLGALTNNPHYPEITFGGLRFTNKPQRTIGQYSTPEDRILKRTVYLVCQNHE